MQYNIVALLQKNGQLVKKERAKFCSMTTLPHTGIAFIYQRQSSYEQKMKNIWSQVQQDRLAALAREDGYPDELIWVEKRDLGVSGRKTEEQREGLAYLIVLAKKRKVESVWVVECSRLYRDMDFINADRLLLLLKEHGVIIVTPERRFGLNSYPDWEAIHQEMMVAVRDSYTRTQKLSGSRTSKALCGLYVGSPVIPGYIVERDKNSPTYDRYTVYPPHKEVVTKILRELIAQRGSELKTAQVLKARGIEFPFFPPEYQYMETRTSLKRCPQSATGYVITPGLIRSLAPNPRMLGWWVWKDEVVSYNNHEAIVDEDLFIAANEALARQHKPRGRGFNSKPLPFTGLLRCGNHDVERHISAHGAEGRYTEDRDYQRGIADICFDIDHRFIDEPLLDCILSRCHFDSYAEEVLSQLESEHSYAKERLRKAKRERERVAGEINTLQQNLDQALAQTTDQSRIERIERLIEEHKAQLADLEAFKRQTLEPTLTGEDIARVRAFLANLKKGWYEQTSELQNEFLRIMLDKVVVRHEGELIEAVIYWRTGFKQQVIIHRPLAKSRRENRWSEDEDKLVRMLFPSSSQDVLTAALPSRSWGSITCRAIRLGLKRDRNYHPPKVWRQWTVEEDAELRQLYEAGVPLDEIATRIGRTRDAVEVRASQRELTRPRDAKWKQGQVTWEEHPYNFIDNNALRWDI